MINAQSTSSPDRHAHLTIRVANVHSDEDADSIVRLLDEYAGDPMGRGKTLEVAAKGRLIGGLAKHQSAIIYLAEGQGGVLGLAVCFMQYSTFGAFDLLNIHDFIVTASARQRGVGRAMLREICQDAKNRGCQKVTLEVRKDNAAAQLLYRSEAFGECEPPMLFWQRPL